MEVWKNFDCNFDVSDFGNVRRADGGKAQLFRLPSGYWCVSLHGCHGYPGNWFQLYVHRMVFKVFGPGMNSMYDMVDHIDRDKSNNKFSNLRRSNVVLNGLNKTGVKGYETKQLKSGTWYQPRLKLLGIGYSRHPCRTANDARAVYLDLKARAFALMEALCHYEVPWDVQNLILHLWTYQRLTKRKSSRKRKWDDPMWRLIRPAPFLRIQKS